MTNRFKKGCAFAVVSVVVVGLSYGVVLSLEQVTTRAKERRQTGTMALPATNRVVQSATAVPR